jgi:uncharacterized protein with NAD-binding domain and iron-sulfur cluster
MRTISENCTIIEEYIELLKKENAALKARLSEFEYQNRKLEQDIKVERLYYLTIIKELQLDIKREQFCHWGLDYDATQTTITKPKAAGE